MIECIFTHSLVIVFYAGFSAFMMHQFWDIAFNTKADNQVIHKIFGIWLFVVAGMGVIASGYVIFRNLSQYWCF